jgi:hypothetical protein
MYQKKENIIVVVLVVVVCIIVEKNKLLGFFNHSRENYTSKVIPLTIFFSAFNCPNGAPKNNKLNT